MPRERHPHLQPGFRDAYNDSPATYEPGDRFYYTVVAVLGEANDWAAYRGYGSPEQVAATGDKIDQKTAEGLFASIARSGRSYRR